MADEASSASCASLWPCASDWVLHHALTACVLISAVAADLCFVLIVCRILRKPLGAAIGGILTITNISTKILFMLKVIHSEGNLGYLFAEAAILLASHLSGVAVIVLSLRHEHAVFATQPGNESLDVDDLHARPGVYTAVLFVSSANLQALKLLPWKLHALKFDGLPSARLYRATYLSLFTGDLPQIVLQVLYVVWEKQADPTVSIISIGCSSLSVLFRFMRCWLVLLSAKAIATRRSTLDRSCSSSLCDRISSSTASMSTGSCSPMSNSMSTPWSTPSQFGSPFGLRGNPAVVLRDTMYTDDSCMVDRNSRNSHLDRNSLLDRNSQLSSHLDGNSHENSQPDSNSQLDRDSTTSSARPTRLTFSEE